MADPNTPATAKVRPADSVLYHAAKAIELEGIEVHVKTSETETARATEGVFKSDKTYERASRSVIPTNK